MLTGRNQGRRPQVGGLANAVARHGLAHLRGKALQVSASAAAMRAAPILCHLYQGQAGNVGQDAPRGLDHAPLAAQVAGVVVRHGLVVLVQLQVASL